MNVDESKVVFKEREIWRVKSTGVREERERERET